MLRYSTAGESHGKGLVTIVEGLPAGLPIDVEFINHQLARRQRGYGRGHRMKIEQDKVEILSGVRHGETLGSPVTLMIENRDFVNWQEVMAVAPVVIAEEKRARRVKRPRPGHADLAGGQKFDRRDLRDILERASARETAARVAAGSLMRLLLRAFGIEIASHVIMLGGVPETPLVADWTAISAVQDDEMLRCVDSQITNLMVAVIDQAQADGDTLGGIFEVVARNVPVGLGTHTQWDGRLDGRLAQAIMAIPAVKAVELGNGTLAARWPGSQFHDEIQYNKENSRFIRRTNRAGGLEGGITNGEELRVRGYLKPIATLRKPLESVDIDTKAAMSAAFERSDITAVPAAGVIGEAAVAFVLAVAMREKFGGDSLAEMQQNFAAYQARLTAY
jgi:chorismate synthase